MSVYTTWDKAREYLDAESLGSDFDVVLMQKFVEEAEQRFDARLRRRFDLPFTVADDPDSYNIAHNVCSIWAAAEYIRNRHQAEGSEEQAWYANNLDTMANQQVGFLETRRAPADAEPNDDPLVYTPYEGNATYVAAMPDAIFRRRNITTGSGYHY